MIKYTQKGEVAIILVLVVTMLTIITTAAVAVAFTSSKDTTSLTIGQEALDVAYSGAENAVLRLLRDSSYAGESNLSIGDGSATIEVTGTTTKTIVSKGVVLGMVRTIRVIVENNLGSFTITSWQEI